MSDVPNMEDLIEAFAFDESEGRGVKYGELTTGPASRRFREAKELAEQAVAAELRRAKAEAWRELVVRLAYFEGLDLNEHPNPYRNEATNDHP